MNFLGKTKREWYWFFETGKPIKKANIYKLIDESFKNIPEPVFFLSTGRTGTAWFADLLSKDKQFMCFHNATPHLSLQNKFYYDIITDPEINILTKKEIGKQIFLAGREEYLVYSYKTQKRFLETNNEYIFLAEVIAEMLPNSKFVHLYRHPGEFVRSGIRRKWYCKEEDYGDKRISLKDKEIWNEYSNIQKVSWFWAEINNYIETLKENISPDRIYEFNFNELNKTSVEGMLNFIGANISSKTITKKLPQKLNIQKSGNFETFENWTSKDKEELRQICGHLAEKYGYEL